MGAVKRVLLVDDEKDFVDALAERLDIRGFEASAVYDGESALALLPEQLPPLVVLDLRMPGIDGISTLRRIMAVKPRTKVVILTGHGSDADRRTCLELGAFEYLHKPVDISRLHDVLTRAGAEQEDMGKEG
jgi:DNA-binding response OmpR family regulator